MKKLFYIFLFFTLTSNAQGRFNLAATINIAADFFTTDNQGNIYIVKADELSKYNKSGRLLYKYSNNNFGKIDFVDASNMMQLLVYYRNFISVLFLDNTLSLISDPISLDKIGFQQTQLTCASHNNGLWLYNQQNSELVRLSQTLETTQQTGNLSLLLNVDMKPDYLLEYDNKIYLNNPSTGILIFDVYGTYYKTVPVKNVQHFQPIGEWLYYIIDNKAKAYNIKTTEEIKFEMPPVAFQNFRLEMDVLFVQTDKSISIYTEQ